MAYSHIVRPRSAAQGFNPRDVAKAYNYPLDKYTGKGRVCGIIELGGGFTQADIDQYFQARGLSVPNVEAVLVGGAQNKPDGPNGADGEVLLDIEVAASVAPDAQFKVYFAPNTDNGFLQAIQRAVADKVDVISISWGGPEDSWSSASIAAFDATFAQARKNGVVVFVAAGDAGSGDGEQGNHVDFPASSPNVVGCGGTRLSVNSDGSRASETVWNDSTTSATGGGVSQHFPGRQVPDVAGNADPVTGYDVLVDGQEFVIGGTSAVAPLYAGLALLLSEALGAPIGSKVDFLSTVETNPTVCYDVTVGDNGAFRAGPGRDEDTGFGVVDGGKLLSVLVGNQPPVNPPVVPPTPPVTPPAPPVDPPTPPVDPPVVPPAPPVNPDDAADVQFAADLHHWLHKRPWFYKRLQEQALEWLDAKGLL